eukprot:Polyplicarium_translucidae@DN3339_c2_g2_i11.p1
MQGIGTRDGHRWVSLVTACRALGHGMGIVGYHWARYHTACTGATLTDEVDEPLDESAVTRIPVTLARGIEVCGKRLPPRSMRFGPFARKLSTVWVPDAGSPVLGTDAFGDLPEDDLNRLVDEAMEGHREEEPLCGVDTKTPATPVEQVHADLTTYPSLADSGPLLLVKVSFPEIDDGEVEATLDTGASHTVIPRRLLEGYNPKRHGNGLRATRSMLIKCGNIARRVYPIAFEKDVADEILLGRDFMGDNAEMLKRLLKYARENVPIAEAEKWTTRL